MTQKKFPNSITIPVKLLLNAAMVDQNVFTADRAYELVDVNGTHGTAGSDGSAVSLDIKKCAATVAPTSGTTMLGTTKYDCKGTANTNQSPALTDTVANRRLAVGDRIAFDFTGTITALADLNVALTLKVLGNS